MSKTAKVALPIELSSPYLAIPTSRKFRFGALPATPTASPTLKFSSLAVPSSITTSFGPRAHRPSTRFSGLKRS
jgi:hypothetical protein